MQSALSAKNWEKSRRSIEHFPFYLLSANFSVRGTTVEKFPPTRYTVSGLRYTYPPWRSVFQSQNWVRLLSDYLGWVKCSQHWREMGLLLQSTATLQPYCRVLMTAFTKAPLNLATWTALSLNLSARDKLVKIIQYVAKILHWYYNRINSDNSTISVLMKVIEQTLSSNSLRHIYIFCERLY